MTEEKLFLNTLTFEYPKKPVKFYFSDKDDAERKSTRLKSPVLVPKEVKQTQKRGETAKVPPLLYST